MSHLRAKSGKPTKPVPPPGSYNHPGQGVYNRSASGAANSSNLEQNPHYADPSKPLTVVQENTQIDEPAYADWEYAFQDSYDVASIGGGAEHLYFYHADHLGSTGYVTRADAAIVEHVQYFPFGETWIQEGKHTERYPYLFTSKELDEESGLYYFGARYYDSRTSVWQSVDPILGEYLSQPEAAAGGVYLPSNLAFFTYARSNPVVLTDPDGNMAPAMPLPPLQGYAAGGAAAGGLASGGTISPDAANGLWSAVKGLGDALGGFIGGAADGHKTLVTNPGQAMLNAEDKIGNLIINKEAKANEGRQGKQQRLREIAGDDKASSANRGWIKQEINSI